MSEDQHNSIRNPWASCLLISLALLFVPFGGLCYFAGSLVGQQQLYNRWTHEKIATLEPLLKDDRFSHLTIDYSSAAQVYFGEAKISEEDFAALEEEVIQLLGRDEADKVLHGLRWSIEDERRKAVSHEEDLERPEQ